MAPSLDFIVGFLLVINFGALLVDRLLRERDVVEWKMKATDWWLKLPEKNWTLLANSASLQSPIPQVNLIFDATTT